MHARRTFMPGAGLMILMSLLPAGRTCQAAGPPAAAPADTALMVERWLDTVSGRLEGPSAILISGDRISGIVPAAGFDRAQARQVIDPGRATVLPGLVDAHVHLEIGGDPAANALAVLKAGFTTVVDLGATSHAILKLRDAISAGSVLGPRVIGAGLWIGTKDGVCEFGGIGIAGGPEGFRRRVRENVAAGADLLKVCVTGWPGEAFEHPARYEIADNSLAAVVSEAGDRLVVAHAISLGGARAALRAGVDGLAHAAYLDEPAAREMKARKVFLIPTLASLTAGPASPAATALRDGVRLAHRTGVPIVFGTDGGVLPHGRNAREFAALAEAGVTGIDAIRAATVNAAESLGVAGAIGAIAPGKSADIIAVQGDPLTDIGSLSRVTFVMRAGKVILGP